MMYGIDYTKQNDFGLDFGAGISNHGFMHKLQ